MWVIGWQREGKQLLNSMKVNRKSMSSSFPLITSEFAKVFGILVNLGTKLFHLLIGRRWPISAVARYLIEAQCRQE